MYFICVIYYLEQIQMYRLCLFYLHIQVSTFNLSVTFLFFKDKHLENFWQLCAHKKRSDQILKKKSLIK